MNSANGSPKTSIFVGFCCLLAFVGDALTAELKLSAFRSGTTLIVSWPSEYLGYYYLQKAANLSTPWATVTNSFSTNRLTFSTDTPSSYYRLAAVSTADPRISRAGLVAEYLFNLGAIDSATYQGLQRNGSLQGGVSPTTNRFGTPNSAWQFNGLTGFIQVPDDDVFSIPTMGQLSISAWMRPDTDTFPKSDGTSPGYWVYWICKIEYGNHCDPSTGSQDEWAFRMYDKDSGETEPAAGTCGPGSPAGRPNWVSIYVFNLCAPGSNFGAGSRTQCSPAAIGQWTHYVATFSYTGISPNYGTIQLYKNGQKIDSDSFVYNGTTVITPANGTAPVRFGKGSGEYYFQGAIDNVRFYNRVLNDQEALDLFHDQTQ